jgi:hypothetical protein
MNPKFEERSNVARQFPHRGLREDEKRWRSVVPAQPNTGDPDSLSRLIRL